MSALAGSNENTTSMCKRSPFTTQFYDPEPDTPASNDMQIGIYQPLRILLLVFYTRQITAEAETFLNTLLTSLHHRGIRVRLASL
jgi:hypothetical protein